VNNELNENLRWRDYFLRQGRTFSEFWNEYLNSKEHDVLFVVGLGFDPRMCTAVENILNTGGNGKRDCFLLKFDEGDESPSKRYEHLISSNRSKLEKMFNGKGEIISKDIEMLSKDGRRIGSRSAANVFSGINDLTNYTDIIVDISAIPRALYFPIIGKLLYLYDSCSTDNNSSKNLNIHVFVVENPTLDSIIQTEGIDDKANYIHAFRGDIELEATANIPRVWIPILGEKRDAHMKRIHTLVNPKEICPVLPFPATNPRRGDDLLIEYRELLFDRLRVEPTNIVYAAEQNPFEVYRKITRTVIQYNKALSPLGGCKIILSALSSKLLSIGTLLAAYDLKRNFKIPVGIAHVEAQGHIMSEENEVTDSKDQEELFSIWLAGESYDA
jgi:hypothetical protein